MCLTKRRDADVEAGGSDNTLLLSRATSGARHHLVRARAARACCAERSLCTGARQRASHGTASPTGTHPPRLGRRRRSCCAATRPASRARPRRLWARCPRARARRATSTRVSRAPLLHAQCTAASPACLRAAAGRVLPAAAPLPLPPTVRRCAHHCCLAAPRAAGTGTSDMHDLLEARRRAAWAAPRRAALPAPPELATAPPPPTPPHPTPAPTRAQVENLLESYFMLIDSVNQKLGSIGARRAALLAAAPSRRRRRTAIFPTRSPSLARAGRGRKPLPPLAVSCRLLPADL